MSYTTNGYPSEFANKIGHIKIIQDPFIQRMIEGFEDYRPTSQGVMPTVTGKINFDRLPEIKQVITVDGGHQVVPNQIRPERQVGFIQVVAQMIKMETIEHLKNHPMLDPREVNGLLNRFIYPLYVALPIAGIHIQNMTLKETIRDSIHRYIVNYQLYDTISFLVYKSWEPQLSTPPSMDCINCGQRFELPRFSLSFQCPHCSHNHNLSDYLGLCDVESDERSSTDTVANFRSIIEALIMFSFIIRFLNNEDIMKKTLFILDGPLLLRSQLSRFVQPIRELIHYQHSRGKSINIVGVEKNGEFRNYADYYSPYLSEEGEYFIPSVQFLIEQINGRNFDPSTYINRVSYGSKAIVRISRDHVLAVNIPTGEFTLTPSIDNLIGFGEIVKALKALVSYAHNNALIPIVLANSAASISNRPSNILLAQFVDLILNNPS
jgi:hypothetical protein